MEAGFIDEFIALVVAVLLVGGTILIHYEILRTTSRQLTHLRIAARMRIVVVLCAGLVSHFAQILLYACGFWLLEHNLKVGSIVGADRGELFDYIYFSAASYTTLGIGDLFPTGGLRLVSGIEALNGLVVVGWTASFTYLTMEKFWHLHSRHPRRRKP